MPARGSHFTIAEQGWYTNISCTEEAAAFTDGEYVVFRCRVQSVTGMLLSVTDGKYDGSITLNGHEVRNLTRAEMAEAMEQGQSFIAAYSTPVRDFVIITAVCRVANPPEAPRVAIADDAKTVQVTGSFDGLYARVALILDNNGRSGLYVTQATINSDGSIVIPTLMIPGLKVKGVNIALVPTLTDIQSAAPTVKATDFILFLDRIH